MGCGLARIASAALWVLAIVTVIGLMYGVMFAVFFFIMHLLFVGHLRGNGGRLGGGSIVARSSRRGPH
jgi:hypothetical protein